MQQLEYVPPRFAEHDLIDRLPSNAEHDAEGDLSMVTLGPKSAYLADLLGREFRAVGLLASWQHLRMQSGAAPVARSDAPSLHGIATVVLPRTSVHVRRPDTSHVAAVTVMEDARRFRRRLVACCQDVRDDVGQPGLTVQSEQAVAGMVPSGKPQPAWPEIEAQGRPVLIDLRPETIFDRTARASALVGVVAVPAAEVASLDEGRLAGVCPSARQTSKLYGHCDPPDRMPRPRHVVACAGLLCCSNYTSQETP